MKTLDGNNVATFSLTGESLPRAITFVFFKGSTCCTSSLRRPEVRVEVLKERGATKQTYRNIGDRGVGVGDGEGTDRAELLKIRPRKGTL